MRRAPSGRSARIPSSAIRRLFDARRPTTVNLGFGEPGAPIPAELLDEGVSRFRAHRIPGYPPNAGLPELRERIAGHHGLAHARGIGNVVVTVGVEEALLATLMAVADPGDEVIVPEPAFLNYRVVAELLGLRVVGVPKAAERGFALDAAAVRSAINDRTRAVLLNSPCNPTGRIDREEELRALVDATEESGVWLVSDEIYSEFHFEARPVSVATLTDRSIVLGALSKTCSFTGLRLGWAVVPDSLSRAVAAVHQYSVTCAPSVSQYVGLVAFENKERWFGSIVPHIARQRELLLEGLRNEVRLPFLPAEGAMYALVDVRSVSRDSVALSETLLREADVLTVPGGAFGEVGEGYIRLTYGANPTEEETAEGIRRIARWLGARQE